MSFRWRLFLCLFVAVLVGTVADAVRDYWELQELYEKQLDDALDKVELFAEVAVDLSLNPPGLRPMTVAMPEGGWFRLLQEGEVVLESDFSDPQAELKLRQVSLDATYLFELGVDTGVFRKRINAELRKDLTDDSMQILLSVFIAWMLSGFLLRPLRVLNKAINEVSQQRFPEPIAVPSGNDVLSQLALSFNRMSSNIQLAIERERVFTRYSSHELRTPLSAIKLQLESLELELSPVEKVLPTVQRNVERMQRVLEALLSLARASEKNHEPISLSHLLKESIQLLPKDVQGRVVVKSLISPNLKVPQPYLMGQCLLNIIDNALKYTDGDVQVTLEPFGSTVQVRVQDQGKGVPEALLENLTTPFFRLSKTVEGSGLGLAFVKHIVRTFKGDLTLKNTAEGLEVTLTLPVAA